MARRKAAAAAAEQTDAQIERQMVTEHHAEVDKQLASLPPNPTTVDPATEFNVPELEKEVVEQMRQEKENGGPGVA